MCPFVEKKNKKALCLVYISTKKLPTLFFQPRPTPNIVPSPPIINNYCNVQPAPPIIPITPIIRESRVAVLSILGNINFVKLIQFTISQRYT